MSDDCHRSYFKPPKQAPTGLKRSPLKRGDSQLERSPLNRGDSQLKRSPMKKGRTAKARRDHDTFLSGPRSELCDRCSTAKATDGSHRGTRAQRPDLRGDQTNRDDLCRPCHDWVEANPTLAKAEGWRDPETYEAANADPMNKIRRRLDQG